MSFEIMGTSLGKSLKMFSGKMKYFRLYNTTLWQRVLADEGLQEWIMDLVREEQLFQKGVDEDGDVIGYYSEYTEMISPEKVAGSHYTLKDTGEFFATFMITIYPSYFEIDANPIKTNDKGETENLFYKYSESILGLTDASKEKLGQEIIRRYIQELRRWLLWMHL
tara:strand:- start:5595 stop:6092 length:498 start_codon:yes stop_codon:yes gene_type:complete